MLLKTLEQKRKPLALAILAATYLVFMPLAILSNGIALNALAVGCLIAGTATAIACFFSGLAMAAMVLSYLLMLMAGVGVMLLLKRFMRPPGLLSDKTLGLIPTLWMVFFTLIIPIPLFVRNMIRNRLGAEPGGSSANDGHGDGAVLKGATAPERQSADARAPKARPAGRDAGDADQRNAGFDSSGHGDGEPDDAEPSDQQSGAGFTYRAFHRFKLQRRYESKPYHLSNLSPVQARWRRIIGIAALAIGLLGQLASVNLEDQATHALESPVFWLLIASLVLTLTGAAILLLGYRRALLVPVICAALALAGYWAAVLLSLLAAASVPLFIATLSALVLLLARLAVWIFGRLFRFRKALVFFERGQLVCGVDLDLKGFHPLTGYPALILATLTQADEASLKTIDRLLDRMTEFCGGRRLVLAGAMLDRGRMTLQLAIYADHEKRLAAVKRFLSRQISSPYRCEVRQDPAWDFYQASLYPEVSGLIQMNNRSLLAYLTDNKFDFDKMQPVVIGFEFTDREQAQAFLDSAERSGYEKAALYDAPDNRSQLVLVQQTIKMTEEWLDTVSLSANELAARYGGAYSGVRLADINVPTVADMRLPEKGQGVRGICLMIPNEYGDYLRQVLDGIDLEHFVWHVRQSEVLFSDTADNRLRIDFFPDPILSGEAFRECITRKEYYVVHANILAYPAARYGAAADPANAPAPAGAADPANAPAPAGAADPADQAYPDTYADFLAGDCQIALLCADSVYVDLYLKDPALAEKAFRNCVRAGFRNVGYITDASDVREQLAV